MHQRVADRRGVNAGPCGDPAALREASLVLAVVARRHAEVDQAREHGGQPCGGPVEIPLAGDDKHAALRPFQDVVETEIAATLPGAALADREQPAEPSVGRPIRWIGENLGAQFQRQSHADDVADAELPRRGVASHDSGEGVGVGDSDSAEAQLAGAGDVFLRVRGAGQKREVAGDGKLGVAHGNLPATNQSGGRSPGWLISHNRGPLHVWTRQ